MEKAREISFAQACIGRNVAQGSILQRAKKGMAVLSILTTWALENAIETADSMKSRGYGLPGRTSFSIFRFDHRDMWVLSVMLGFIALIVTGAGMGMNAMRFFPSIRVMDVSMLSMLVYAAYLFLCMLPIIITIVEELKWRRIESSM